MSQAHHDLDLEQLFEQHYDFLWRTALRTGVPYESVEDVLQETFLAAYRRLHTFEGRAQPHVWLCSFLLNVSRNFDRKRRRGDRKQSNYCAAALARVESTHRQSTFSAQQLLALGRLEAFLATLDADKRAVFVLAELEGMTGREIADSLDININTAHARLRAARAEFCDRFGEDAHATFARRAAAARERPERAPEESRTRTRALLIGALPRPERGWTASAPVLTKHAAISIVSFCVSALAFVPIVALSRTPEIRPVASASPRTTVADSRVATAEPLGPSIEAPRSESEPILVTAAQRGPRASRKAARPDPSPEPTSAEYLAFTRARQALVVGRFEQALTAAEPISANGPLAAQRARLQCDALCGLGRESEARQLAAAWNAAHAGDVIAPICW